jgi:hypothetical protein
MLERRVLKHGQFCAGGRAANIQVTREWAQRGALAVQKYGLFADTKPSRHDTLGRVIAAVSTHLEVYMML